MKNERLLILEMVNEGKITVDEAIKLIDSLKKSTSFDASDMIDTVKEKVNDFVDDAKPVVKKYASKAMEMGEDVYHKGKAKMGQYKRKVKDSDIIDEVPEASVIDDENDVVDESTNDKE